MHHLLPVCILVVITFFLLTRRHSAERSYSLLVSVPTVLLLIALGDESFRGIHQINHQLLHVAYDSSYTLLLLGLILLLRAVLKRRLITLIATGTCIAGIPLGHIFITHQ